MASRKEFLNQLWKDNINAYMKEQWIENKIRDAECNPNSPFADVGPVLKRLLALGATCKELSLIARHSAYEAVFGTLYAFSDPGIDHNDIEILHKSLLFADPSGNEGRPG